MRGFSYLPLPSWLSKKEVIIHPKNDDLEWLRWAVTAADKWEEIGKHLERISKPRKYEVEYDWSDVEFPFATHRIAGFEKKNEISVNILAVDDDDYHKRIFIPRKSTRNYGCTVNLMIITGKDDP